MTREEIQKERMRLGAEIAALELKCSHEVYEVEEYEQVYDWRSEVWYNCFCHDCYKQWTVYQSSKNFDKVREKYKLLQENLE